MTTFLFAFAAMMVVVAAMSVGVIVGRSRVKGSCGGVGNIPGLDKQCDCDNPCELKQKVREAAAKRERENHLSA